MRILLAAALLWPAPPPAAPPPAAPPDLHPCAAASTRCEGEISVPLNWSDPGGERIRVAFAWLPAARAKGTVLADPGGPLPALPALPIIEETLGPVLRDHNLLAVEPRGQGRSSPLRCQGLDLARPSTVASCAAQLGPRAQYFATDQAVSDLDAVRQALGVPKVSFYGNSYGTLFAQAYAARFPDRTAAVFLDSVVTPSPAGRATWPIRFRLDNLDLVCRSSSACARLPGEAGRTFARLVKRVRAHPDPELPMRALVALSRSPQEATVGRELAAATVSYLRGDRAPLHRLAEVVRAMPMPPTAGAEWAGYVAYLCNDGAFAFDRTAGAARRAAQLAAYHAGERPTYPFTLAELGGMTPAHLCVDWPTPRDEPPVPPAAAFPAVPALAVAGDFDTHGPAEVSPVIRRFPRGTLLPVRYGAHSMAWSEGCARTVLRAFLSDPGRAPAVTGCDLANYTAIGSFPLSGADVKPMPARTLPARDRRPAAVGYATAADVLSRRNPLSFLHAGLTEQAGLRGGRVTFAGDGRVIRLDQVRYTADVAVSGTLTLGETVSADLTVDGRAVKLSWKPFQATERTAISGSVDGRPFTSLS
ncbi:alpha/beta fold hydrolase [Nonomuraea sp. NPDC003727]